MWLVAKIKNNNYEIFKNEILKIEKNVEFYEPKYKISFVTKKKTKILKKNLFNTYIFCKISNYNQFSLNKIKFCKGLKYYLSGYELYQKSIIQFIDYCKSFEDENKFITNAFFKNLVSEKGKFFSGPLRNIIFEKKKKKKNKVIVTFGKFIATVRDNKAIYAPA